MTVDDPGVDFGWRKLALACHTPKPMPNAIINGIRRASNTASSYKPVCGGKPTGTGLCANAVPSVNTNAPNVAAAMAI